MFGVIFPDEEIDMQKLHHISSYLFKTIEEFLAWYEWKSDQAEVDMALLKSYRRLQQPQLFFKVLEKSVKNLEQSQVKGSQYHHQLFQLENLRFSQMRTVSKNRNFGLQKLSDLQDEAFLIQILKTACLLLSSQAVSKSTYDLGLIPIVQNYCTAKNFLNNPTLAIYYYASKALSDFQDDDSFHSLKELLLEHRSRFNISELYDIHVFALNYGIRRLNMGEKHFMREIFEIYQSGIVSKIFKEKDMLAPRTYSNIVMSGLRLGEYEAVESFIYEYKKELPEQQREGLFNYNLAHLHYERKNYKDAMPLLLQIETSDELIACTSKTLLAKMYFELNENESLTNLIQSFKIYLKRKKILGYHRDLYSNFILLLNKIIHIKDNKNQKEYLFNEIKNKKVLAEKSWLLEQITNK
ncbi:MAG: hypothetical protein AAFZ15_05085 [Bacteroidota bacterium]